MRPEAPEAARSESPRRRRFRWRGVALGLGALTLISIAALVGLVFALSSGWARSWLRAELADRIAAGTGAQVEIGALRGPLYPSFTVLDVSARWPGGSAVQIGQLHARLDARRSWAERALVLGLLSIEHVHAFVAQEGQAGDDAEEPSSSSPPPSVPLRVAAVRLADIRVEVGNAPAAPRLSVLLSGRLAELALDRPGVAWPQQTALELGVRLPALAERGLGDVELSLTGSSPDALELEARIAGPSGQARLHGSAELGGWLARTAPASLDLRGHARALDLDPLTGFPALRSQLAGSLELRARLAAGVSSAEVVADLRDDSVAEPGVRRLGIQATLDDASWTLREAKLSGSALELSAHGRGSFDAVASLEVEGSVPDLGALGRPRDWTPGGQARLAASLSGPWKTLGGHLRLRGSELVLRGQPLGEAVLELRREPSASIRLERLSLRGPSLEVSADPATFQMREGQLHTSGLTLRSDGMRMELAGAIGPSGFAGAILRLSDVDLQRALGPFLPERDVGGQVHASLVLEGPLRRPRPTGVIVWESPQVAGTVAERIYVDVGSDGRGIAGQGRLELGGRVAAAFQVRLATELLDRPWDRMLHSPGLSFELDGSALDLAFVGPFLPRWARGVRGKASVSAFVRGAATGPEMGGRLAIADGSFRAPAAGMTYGPLELALLVEPGRLVLEQLSIGAEPQRADIRGALEWNGAEPAGIELDVVFHDFRALRRPRARFGLDGRLRVAGSLAAPALSGNVELRRARLAPPEPESALWKQVRILGLPTEGTSVRESVQPYDRALIQVGVRVPPDTRIASREADLQVEGELEAVKKPLGPLRLVGELQVVRGTYRLGQRRLDIDGGRLRLTGEAQFDPTFEVRGRSRVQGVEIDVALSGRISNPTLSLSSEPALPRSDLLSLLLLGRRSEDLDAAQAGDLQSVAAQLGANFALDELRTHLGSAFPLDTVGVDVDEDEQAAKLELGKQVGERVFVTFGETFGEETTEEVEVEWRVTPSVRLKGRASSEGEAGADVIWSKDY